MTAVSIETNINTSEDSTFPKYSECLCVPIIIRAESFPNTEMVLIVGPESSIVFRIDEEKQGIYHTVTDLIFGKDNPYKFIRFMRRDEYIKIFGA